ncbi:MAG: hypothetical protein IJ438_05600 [Clostridia bacterium]|nr:hypothetical protein [Clostridia bacterium]
MDRILMVMQTVEYADAEAALLSAKENAFFPEALSYGLVLTQEPDADAHAAMNALGLTQFICPGDDPWRAAPLLWQGEGYILLAHPAMRFSRGWDKEILRALRACPMGQLLKNVLTGYLPVREDPLGTVCPVAADGFTDAGALTFHHGTPLRYAASPVRGPFLHPDFCFAPAGFFRMAAEGEGPLFLRAFRGGWDLYTLHKPLIELLWATEVAPETALADDPSLADFSALYGVDIPGRLLSPHARRGMHSEDMTFSIKVPLQVKAAEKVRQWQLQGSKVTPLCVTAVTGDAEDEKLRWLQQLVNLRHMAILVYADAQNLRAVSQIHPNVLEYKSRYGMELRVDAPEVITRLSKSAILGVARDKFLTHSHYVWIDPDCIRYPVYDRAALDWDAICTDRIVMAMVNGMPDTTMFAVPDHLVLSLARELEGRCLTILGQRGQLPAENELWEIVIRENPDWFQLVALPVRRQLFTQIAELRH